MVAVRVACRKPPKWWLAPTRLRRHEMRALRIIRQQLVEVSIGEKGRQITIVADDYFLCLVGSTGNDSIRLAKAWRL